MIAIWNRHRWPPSNPCAVAPVGGSGSSPPACGPGPADPPAAGRGMGGGGRSSQVRQNETETGMYGFADTMGNGSGVPRRGHAAPGRAPRPHSTPGTLVVVASCELRGPSPASPGTLAPARENNHTLKKCFDSPTSGGLHWRP